MYSDNATDKQINFALSLWKTLNEVVIDTEDPAVNWQGNAEQTAKADALLSRTLSELDKPVVKRLGETEFILNTVQVIEALETHLTEFTKPEISSVIDRLKNLVDSARAEVARIGITIKPEWADKYPAVPADAERVIDSRFASKCSVCGKRDQYIAYNRRGSWYPLCEVCAHRNGDDNGDDQLDELIQQVAVALSKGNNEVLNVGLAIANADELDGFSYYRVSRSGVAKVKGGQHFNATENVSPSKAVALLETIVTGDVVAMAQAFGQHFTICGVCSRALKDAESKARGIGPDCASNLS
jgi:hypothetical protein